MSILVNTGLEAMSLSTKPFASTLAFWSALLSALAIAGLTIGGGMGTPDYSHVSQFISELGARGALHERAVRFAGFLPAGIVLLVYCIAAHTALPKSGLKTAGLIGLAIYASGYVVAAFWPCDFGCRPEQPSLAQFIHNAVGGIGYLLAPVSMFLLAHSARSWPDAKHLVTLGYAAAAIALVGMLTLDPASPFVGLSQRAIESAVLAWVVTSGFYIKSRASRAVPAASRAT
jgi:hypothetical protein